MVSKVKRVLVPSSRSVISLLLLTSMSQMSFLPQATAGLKEWLRLPKNPAQVDRAFDDLYTLSNSVAEPGDLELAINKVFDRIERADRRVDKGVALERMREVLGGLSRQPIYAAVVFRATLKLSSLEQHRPVSGAAARGPSPGYARAVEQSGAGAAGGGVQLVVPRPGREGDGGGAGRAARGALGVISPRGRAAPASSEAPTVDPLQRLEAQTRRAFVRAGVPVDLLESLDQNYERKRFQLRGHTALLYWNKGNGDCGLHGLRISRQEFVARALRAFDDPAKQRTVKAFLRDDVFDSCVQAGRGDACVAISDPDRDGETHAQFRDFVATTLASQDEYLTFHPHARGGSLALAAWLFHRNVSVWTGPGPNLDLGQRFAFGDPQDSVVNLRHSGQHFDSLVMPNDLRGREHFLNQEQANLRDLLRISPADEAAIEAALAEEGGSPHRRSQSRSARGGR